MLSSQPFSNIPAVQGTTQKISESGERACCFTTLNLSLSLSRSLFVLLVLYFVLVLYVYPKAAAVLHTRTFKAINLQLRRWIPNRPSMQAAFLVARSGYISRLTSIQTGSIGPTGIVTRDCDGENTKPGVKVARFQYFHTCRASGGFCPGFRPGIGSDKNSCIS